MSKNDVLEKENITINVRIHDNYTDDPEMSELLCLADMEKNHIRHVLDVVKWNKLDASHILNITRPTLNAKIEKYNLVQ